MNKIEKPQVPSQANQTSGPAPGLGAEPGDAPKSSGDAGVAMIGSSIKLVGDLTGAEDLIINGTVEGTINFRENQVSVGEEGRVNANVTARNIIISGEVKGELRGSEQVTIKPTGRVTGDIRAPRVVLNDGCQFKGVGGYGRQTSCSGRPEDGCVQARQQTVS